ncbi:hypothetical protein ACFL2H_03965 [Planctomycetota bacterium]
MMEFGKYSVAVDEVVKLVLRNTLLVNEFEERRAGTNVNIIQSMDDVDRYRDPDSADAEITGDHNWVDIKRSDEERFASIPELEDEYWPTYEALTGQIHSLVKQQLSNVISEYEIEEIGGDFGAIAYQRARMGIVSDSFYETLFAVYQADGYPCGWKGEYPAGCLVVFSRVDNPSSSSGTLIR